MLTKQLNTNRSSHRMNLIIAIALALAFFTCASCATEPAQTKHEAQDVINILSEEQAQVVTEARKEQAEKSYSKEEQAAIDLAISKVNDKIPASRDTVTNIRIRSIQWPDSSLGCAEPGVEYLQKVTPGYLVNLKVDEEFYTVNVGDNRAVICDRINEFMLERRKRADSIMRSHKAAVLDLAERLNVDSELVKVRELKLETWPDSSLGCPHSDQQYKEGPIDGLRINMTCRDKQYEYRVLLEGGDFVICEKIVSCHETE